MIVTPAPCGAHSQSSEDTMTDNKFSALDDVLKDEIRRSFEACQSQEIGRAHV